MNKNDKTDDTSPFDSVKNFDKFVGRFETDNQKIFKNINDLEQLRDKVEGDLFKLKDEKKRKAEVYKEELETRITNGTYKQYFKDKFSTNHKMYNMFKEEVIDVYRKHEFEEQFIDLLWGKNINELVEEFPEPTYCFCNKVSEGDMISCEGKYCEYEWFHVSCVGVVPENESFICSSCTNLQNTFEELTDKARSKIRTEAEYKKTPCKS